MSALSVTMSLSYQFDASSLIKEGRSSRVLVNEIKDWLLTKSLPQLGEESIVLFLLSCQNDVANTKETIKAYFRIKSETPEMFNDRDIDSPALEKAMKVVIVCSLPVRLPPNTIIHYFKLQDTNYQNFDLVASMKLAFMLIDVTQRHNPPNDLVVVLDLKGLGLMHLTRIKMHAIKKFLEFLQEAMPLKIKIIHILNATYIFDKILAVARVFIKNELMTMLKTHPPEMSMEQFYKDWIPASCLPFEYGGQLPTSEELNRKTIEQFRELKSFFEAEEKLRQFC